MSSDKRLQTASLHTPPLFVPADASPHSEQWDRLKVARIHYSDMFGGDILPPQKTSTFPEPWANPVCQSEWKHYELICSRGNVTVVFTYICVFVLFVFFHQPVFSLCVLSIRARPICMCLKTGVDHLWHSSERTCTSLFTLM